MGKVDLTKYSFQSINKGDYLHFIAEGKENFEASIHFIKRAMEEILASGLRKALYEESFEGTVITNELVKIGEFLLQLPRSSGYKIKVAYLNHCPEKNDQIELFENFLVNRGFNIKIFSDKAEALEWLVE